MNTPGNWIFSTVDKNDPVQIHTYERALYRAFCRTDNLDYIWNINHKTKTISTKIPYETQEIYSGFLGERLVAAAALNFGLSSALQLELEGFSIDKSNSNTCEVLQMFCLADLSSGLIVLKRFAETFLKKLIDRGITHIYGTCSERRVRPYTMIGLTPIDERIYNNEKVFLLKLDTRKLHSEKG